MSRIGWKDTTCIQSVAEALPVDLKTGVWGSMEQKTGVRLLTDWFRRKTPNFRNTGDGVEKRRLGALHKFVAKLKYFATIFATQRNQGEQW